MSLAALCSHPAPFTSPTTPHPPPNCTTRFKCAPPIRERENQGRLWAGLRDGTIDLLASDHSPAHPSFKLVDNNFMLSWGGIAGKAGRSLEHSCSLGEGTRGWGHRRQVGCLGLVRLSQLKGRTVGLALHLWMLH